MHHEVDAPLQQRHFEFAREETLLHAAGEIRRLVDVAARGDHGDIRVPAGGRRARIEFLQLGAGLPERQVAATAADVTRAHGLSRRAAAMNWCSIAFTSEVTLRARCGGSPSSNPGSLFCMNSVRMAVIAASVSLGGGASNV